MDCDKSLRCLKGNLEISLSEMLCTKAKKGLQYK